MPFSTSNFTLNNRVEIVKGGTPFFSTLISEIKKSEKSIYFQTYIFANDYTGNLIFTELFNAAKRNVKVYILLDGYGSKDFDKNNIQKLVDAGVEFRFFAPLFSGKNLSIGRRLHHKVVVFDQKTALVGGINIADKYNEVNNKPAWLDYAILTEGNVVNEILLRCIELQQKKYINKENLPFDFTTEFNVPVKLNINDYLRGKKEISKSYKNAFSCASNSIIIMGSYFIPGRGIRKRLKRASKSGVSVKLILTKYSDVWLASAASRYLYNWLLKNDIEIYEWKNSVLHAKVAVVDEEWFTIGSHNLNFLSDYESIEMNLEVINKSLAKEFNNQLLEIIKNNCDNITYSEFKKLPFIYLVFYRFAFYILRYTWRFFYSFRKIENLQNI